MLLKFFYFEIGFFRTMILFIMINLLSNYNIRDKVDLDTDMRINTLNNEDEFNEIITYLSQWYKLRKDTKLS